MFFFLTLRLVGNSFAQTFSRMSCFMLSQLIWFLAEINSSFGWQSKCGDPQYRVQEHHSNFLQYHWVTMPLFSPTKPTHRCLNIYWPFPHPNLIKFVEYCCFVPRFESFKQQIFPGNVVPSSGDWNMGGKCVKTRSVDRCQESHFEIFTSWFEVSKAIHLRNFFLK